jgi:fused signal recognition particle receptor
MKWIDKVKNTFASTANKITQAVSDIINKKALDQSAIVGLQEELLKADLGSKITTDIIAKIKQIKFEKDLDPQLVKQEIAQFIAQSFDDTLPKSIHFIDGVNVILVCGVNGNGKTTTIGKMAHYYKQQNKKVVLAACDTFRAAATEQLEHWANVCQIPIIKGEKVGADPASVAYKAFEAAKSINADILFIDTAGRLNNNKNLMDELAKIKKVLSKQDANAPHHCLLVLDATTGQNALNQVRDFKAIIPNLNGLVVTKMDSTAKAGTVLGIVKEFKVPVYFIGTGEKIEDLESFDPAKFAYNLLK